MIGSDTTGTPSVTLTYSVAAVPTASISTPVDGATYALGQAVSSSFSCAEGAGGTGISACTDQGRQASGAAIDTSTTGQHTYTVTAISKDGLTGKASVTYTVAGAPSVSITSPSSGAGYTSGQVVDAGYGCQEGASGPGLSSCSGTVPAGQPIDTDSPGVHSFAVTAISRDGQSTTSTVSYTVALPANGFAITHVRTQTNGKVSFNVTFPGPGSADVLETAWRDNFARTSRLPQPQLLQPAPGRFVFARQHLGVSQAGAIKLTVKPNRRGQRLVAHHRYAISIRLWVSYTPTGGRRRDIGLYGVRITHPKHG